MDTSSLPTVNAVLNSISAILLAVGFVLIKLKRPRAHRACMIAAFTTSTIFLISYLIYHSFHGSTSFTGTGWIRPLYFSILLTHTVLATAMVPFILTTFYRAFRGQFSRHIKIARWTLPAWLYVSVTGVIVYLMLYKLYPR